MKPMTEEHLAILRRHMVEIIDMHFDLASDEIGKSEPASDLRRALHDVPRHLFVPEQLSAMAYQDNPLPIGFHKTLSQPFIGALMLDQLSAPGRMVIPLGDEDVQQLSVVEKLVDGRVETNPLMLVRFTCLETAG